MTSGVNTTTDHKTLRTQRQKKMSHQLHKEIIAVLVIALIAVCAGNTARTCYSCEGINCMRTSLSTTQKCLDPLDYCVTVFENFSVVRKGCSLEVPIELRSRCDANTVECHKCNADRCNSMGQADFTCLQCDSSKDANCSINPSSFSPTRCPAPTAPNSYCYVKYENGVTKRGCAIAVAEQQKCFGDANCMLCRPGDINGCNSVDFQPGARGRFFKIFN